MPPIVVLGLSTVPYRTYPLVDHLADKHAAMIDTHLGRPSTRYRDLVDIVEIATTQAIDAQPLSVALFTEYRLRNLHAPARFESPGERWPDGYEALARSVPGFTQQTFEEAMGSPGHCSTQSLLVVPAVSGTPQSFPGPIDHQLIWRAVDDALRP